MVGVRSEVRMYESSAILYYNHTFRFCYMRVYGKQRFKNLQCRKRAPFYNFSHEPFMQCHYSKKTGFSTQIMAPTLHRALVQYFLPGFLFTSCNFRSPRHRRRCSPDILCCSKRALHQTFASLQVIFSSQVSLPIVQNG